MLLDLFRVSLAYHALHKWGFLKKYNVKSCFVFILFLFLFYTCTDSVKIMPCACVCLVAGEIRLLPSARLLTEAQRARQPTEQPFSISDVLNVLRLQITVAECDVFAYPSIESDLVVIVMPITASPTPLQVPTGLTCVIT